MKTKIPKLPKSAKFDLIVLHLKERICRRHMVRSCKDSLAWLAARDNYLVGVANHQSRDAATWRDTTQNGTDIPSPQSNAVDEKLGSFQRFSHES